MYHNELLYKSDPRDRFYEYEAHHEVEEGEIVLVAEAQKVPAREHRVGPCKKKQGVTRGSQGGCKGVAKWRAPRRPLHEKREVRECVRESACERGEM